MSIQDVLVPCRRFEVEVTVGAHDGLSIIEQFLLRGVAAGARDTESLTALLALPPRMVLDAAIDLLARGLLDIASGGDLEISDPVRQAIGDPATPQRHWYLAFQSADLPDPRTIPLAQDLVAGEVFLARRVPPVDRPRLPVMPVNAAVCDVDKIPSGMLFTAVTNAMRTLRQQAPADDLRGHVPRVDRDARVLSVRLRRSAPVGGPASYVDVRSMPLMAQVDVRDRGEDNPPRVNIIGPDAIPIWARRSIASALDDLWMRGFGRGPRQFFDRINVLESSAVSDQAEALLVTPKAALESIDAVLRGSGDPFAQHAELTKLEDEIRPWIERFASYSATAEVIVGTAQEFQRVALEALRGATRQVVLACPWIRQLGRDAELQEATREAVRRGVTVVLVWGIDSEVLPESDPAWSFLAALERDARGWPGALAIARRGAASHAKVVVSDVEWAVVSSCNYLNASHQKTDREVGIRVRVDEAGVVPLTIHAVLGWLRRSLPDYLIQERCLDDPALFERSEQRVPIVLGEAVLPPQLDFGQQGIDVWRNTWLARRSEIEGMAGLGSSAVVPVYDSQHRELFVRAIWAAKRRLLIASHQVRTQGLSESVVEALLSALERSVDVRIWHDASAYLEVEPEARRRMERLIEAGASVNAAATHAKVLVCDDWSLISSHNFLSVDPGTRSAHELGLQAFDANLADRLWDAFVASS